MVMTMSNAADFSSFASEHGFEIPQFEVFSFAEKSSDWAVVIPVLNEGERIRKQLERMRNERLNSGAGDKYDIILVDGGSKDSSANPEYLKSMGVNTLLVKKGSGRLGAQLRLGQAFCLFRRYRGIVHVDGNNKDGTEAIFDFINELKNGFDFVQGSRFVKGGKAENTPMLRYWGIRLLHAPMLSIASGKWFTDTTNGFKAVSSKLMMDPRIRFFRNEFAGYEYHYYMAYSAAKRRYRCKEIPVRRSYPVNEPTPTKIHGFRGNLNVLLRLFDVCRGKYD